MMNSPYLVMGGVALIILLALVIYARTATATIKNVSTPHPSASIAKPARPPFSAPTWSARGDWAIPFAVRYAVSFARGDGAEGPLSDWGPYLRSSQFSNPILSRFPVALQEEGLPAIDRIKIYRQFEGHQPIILDSVPYPYLSRFTDRSGDDF